MLAEWHRTYACIHLATFNQVSFCGVWFLFFPNDSHSPRSWYITGAAPVDKIWLYHCVAYKVGFVCPYCSWWSGIPPAHMHLKTTKSTIFDWAAQNAEAFYVITIAPSLAIIHSLTKLPVSQHEHTSEHKTHSLAFISSSPPPPPTLYVAKIAVE